MRISMLIAGTIERDVGESLKRFSTVEALLRQAEHGHGFSRTRTWIRACGLLGAAEAGPLGHRSASSASMVKDRDRGVIHHAHDPRSEGTTAPLRCFAPAPRLSLVDRDV